jgi:hypothetical protein
MEETESLETPLEVILLAVLKRETFQDDPGRKFSNFCYLVQIMLILVRIRNTSPIETEPFFTLRERCTIFCHS